MSDIELLNAILENTLNELDVARKVAIKDTAHLGYKDCEIIQKDYNTAIKLFEKLRNELSQRCSSENLENYVEEHYEAKENMKRAELKANELSQNLKVLKLDMADEDIQNYQEAHSLNMQLGMLKDQHQNEVLEHSIKSKYSADYLEDQCDQLQLTYSKQERYLTEQVKQLEKILEQEHRVHDELEDFYSMKLGEYIQQLVYWVDKYEQDKNRYDTKIVNMKIEYENLIQRMAAAKELYASRQAEITAWEETKERRRLEELRLAHLNANATKIQAWWKGMMVRCKLGPYKVKKSRGKEKNKKK